MYSTTRIRVKRVGNDIGCGMALWQTDLARRKLKVEHAADPLQGLEGLWDGDFADRRVR